MADELQVKQDEVDDLRKEFRIVKHAKDSLHKEVSSLTELCNQHTEYIGRLESKVERGATSLGGGTGRAKLKLLEVKT